MSLLDAALALATRGLAVFPLLPGTKRPLTANGFKAATTGPERVREWWTETPDANIGVATGNISSITVLDVDVKEGKQGDVSLAELTEQYGDLPITPKQETWSGGAQYVFAYAPGVRNSAGKLGEGLDVRGDGGYIVVPPSIVSEDGRTGEYVWEPYAGLDDTPFSPMPEWMIARLTVIASAGRKNEANWADDVVDGVSPGKRDDTAWRLIKRYVFKGLSEKEVLGYMLAWAAKCGFEPDKIREKVARAFRGLGSKPLLDLPLTDVGNAERMILLSGDRFRWVPGGKGEWLAWDGRRWAPGSTEPVIGIALDAARSLGIAAAKARQGEDMPEKRKLSLLSHAVRSEATQSILHAVKAATIPSLGVNVERKALDANPDLLNVANGTLSLKMFALRPHDPADLMTQLIDIPYDPDAPAPRWGEFLKEVFEDKQDVIDYVQRAVGYSLVGSIEEQCFFLLLGSGANGKSTFVDALSALLGDYGVKVGQEALLTAERNKGRSATPEVMVLQGKRFAYVNEMDEGRQLDEARIKAMTGSKEETGRQLYKGMEIWKNTHKLWFDLNHLPTFKGIDEGISRRPRVIPFNRKFELSEQDKTLPETLKAELPGILAWAVEGCRQWRAQGLNPPEAVLQATRQYIESQNHLPTFMAETYVRQKGSFVLTGAVTEAYQRWCRANDAEPVTSKKLASFLTNSYGLKPQRREHNTIRVWVGIALKPQEKAPAGGNQGGTPGDATSKTPRENDSYRKVTNTRPPMSPSGAPEPSSADPDDVFTGPGGHTL